MALFNRSFKKHIQDELKFRKTFHGAQNVLTPHVRVTSLVEGKLTDSGGKQHPITGLTLGLSDLDKISSLGSYFNTEGQAGTVIGVTYPNKGTAKPVSINTHAKNLPPPGITAVTISTQSKGGFVFKATIQLKFYGKDQYDFIYQTFLRPGNPIVVEYGHTRSSIDGGGNIKDLDFFNELGDKFNQYRKNFKDNIPLPTTENSGAIIGLVSNFRTRLNTQNEYEAEIELTNSLEFLFTLKPEDTFLNYRAGSDESTSIRENFGMSGEEGWQPEHDKFFTKIMTEGLMKPDEVEAEGSHEWMYLLGTGGQIASARGVRPNPQASRRNRAGRDKQIILPSEWTEYKMFFSFGSGPEVADVDERTADVTDVEGAKSVRENQQEYIFKHSDNVYVSLFYFFNTLLQDIVNQSFSNMQGLLENVGLFDIVYNEGDALTGVGSGVKYYRDLRSVDLTKVIINNSQLYDVQAYRGDDETGERQVSRHFWTNRTPAYSKKYRADDVSELFYVISNWGPAGISGGKELYGRGDPLGGIFINYTVIRNAFQFSNSVAEAIQRVLNAVNGATSGILNLKMRFIEKDDVTTVQERGAELLNLDAIQLGEDFLEDILETKQQQYRLAIYDESSAIADPDQRKQLEIYNFFEEDVSEAVSYDMDFSLPSSIAAVVQASTFSPVEHHAAGGDPQSKAFIDYGYALDDDGNVAIRSMIDLERLYSNGPPEEEESLYGSTHSRSSALGELQLATSILNQKTADIRQNIIDRDYPQGDLTAPGGVVTYGGEGGRAAIAGAGGATPQAVIEAGIQGEIRERLEADPEAALALKIIEEDRAKYKLQQIPESKLHRQILGYQELMPTAMKTAAVRDGLYQMIPSSAQINIKLQGIDGFRFGDMFSVKNLLPKPYDEANVFMLTGYKHTITSTGWDTDIQGTLIASKPANRR